MKPKIKTSGFPPNHLSKYGNLHTAVSKGIAAFFYSTPFGLLLPLISKPDENIYQSAFAEKQMRFLYVKKRKVLLCDSLFCLLHSNRKGKLYCFNSDRLLLPDENGQAGILTKWQTFIGKYP